MSEKSSVVTGAGTGIGQAIAIVMAKRGYVVLAVGRNRASLEQTQQLIADFGGTCVIHPGDMGRADVAVQVMQAADQQFGRIDVLVNNAAQAVVAPVASLDIPAFDAMLKVNAAGVVYACQAVWQIMKRGGGGTIVNISSMAAADPFPGLAAYGATKAFVNLLTKGMAAEGKPDDIRVFAVGPGAVETQMLRSAFPDFPEEQTLPPGAIAEMVATLTEPSCKYCTGQTIYVSK